MDAIVYTSSTGSTKDYAMLLGKETGLKVYSLEEAKTSLKNNSEIIYLGWVMASNVKGFKKANKLYNIKAVCGVCSGKTGSQLNEIRKANKVNNDVFVFSIQGRFDINKLKGLNKFLIKFISKSQIKKLQEKQNRTPDEEEALNMFLYGMDNVSIDNLKDILIWYNMREKK